MGGATRTGGRAEPGGIEPGARRGAAVAGLLLAMVAGSLILWIGIPLGWLWLAGRLSEDYPVIYMIALVAVPLTMIAWGILLQRLNRAWVAVTGGQVERERSAWLKSLSGERGRGGPRTVLDVIMIASVIAALLLFFVWFFFLAGSSLPLSE